MTRKSFIPLTMLAVGAVASVAPQGDQPAEKVYKNIKVLTGTPSKDVLPAMQFMSASLKVECVFCHDPQDFSADTKDQKEAARHMITMQRKIDADFFNGRTQVTCMTCHNGKEHPSSAPVPAGLNRRHTRLTDGPKAADVVARFRTAIGTVPAAIQLTGSVTHGDQNWGATELTQTSEGKFLSKGSFVTFGYDGHGYWNQMQGKVEQIPEDAMKSFDRFMGPVWSANSTNRLSDLTVAGSDKIGEKNVIVLRAGSPGKGMEELYFDQSTGLLIRDVVFNSTVLGTMADMVDFGDYRNVNGVMVPFDVVDTTAGGETTHFKGDSAKVIVPNPDTFTTPKSGL